MLIIHLNGGVRMSEGFGSDFISIVDEETNEEFELEIVETMLYNEKSYILALPADMSEDDEDYGFIILATGEENGESYFESVDDEDELTEVYERFMALLDEEDEEETNQ